MSDLAQGVAGATSPAFARPRVWWAIGFAGVVLLIVLSLMPDPPSLGTDPSGWGDHGLAYAVLMGWFARLSPERRRRIGIAIALVALGVLLEYAQRMTGYRTFDVGDMGADALGVLVGWLLSPPRIPNGLPAVDRMLFGARR